MCLGVLVAEAGETSGAMITAHLALEQNREVFAIPGSILSPSSRGTNHLIQEGAKLVSSYTDILEELNLTAVAHQIEMKEIIPATETESLLLKQLGTEPTHIDEVCRASGLPISTVSSTLAMMELKGLVKQVGTMNYVLSREAGQEYAKQYANSCRAAKTAMSHLILRLSECGLQPTSRRSRRPAAAWRTPFTHQARFPSRSSRPWRFNPASAAHRCTA
jgi:hypothetical protein